MDAGNWITLVLGLGTLALGAASAYAQWPRRTDGSNPTSSNRVVALMLVLSVIVVGSVAYDIYDRHHQVHHDTVISWGGAGTNYHMVVATHELQDVAKTQRMMMVVRPNLMGIDPLTDTNIGKSGLYTITGPAVTLVVPTNTPLRMVVNQPNIMEYIAVLLPVGIGPERIRTLADVIDLGGRIYQTRGSSVMAGSPIDPSTLPVPAK
jgi:hypothetical protein